MGWLVGRVGREQLGGSRGAAPARLPDGGTPCGHPIPCRVELKPTLQQLFDTVHGTCNAAVAALEVLPRLAPEVLSGCVAAGPVPACLR